jgi:hypothetical protein
VVNTAVITRAGLIYGICVPLAVLLGYLLAEPFESGSIAVVMLVFAVLCIPLLMRWHHGFLIFCCNAAIYPYFLPGRPSLWMVGAVISFSFLALNRCLGTDVPFFRARKVSMSLIAIAVVVLVTAYFTGGIGFAAFGARNAGGKRYFSILVSILMYFALSTIPIKRKYAALAVTVFFLSGLTGLFSYVAALGGSNFYFLAELFPVDTALDDTASTPDVIATGIVRLGQLGTVATGFFCFLLARFGARGILDVARPWRFLLLGGVMLGSLYSGYRSGMILLLLTFLILFYYEGLFRTRYFPALIMAFALGGAVMIPFAQKLPLVVQRTLCFLPINVDPVVRDNADGSTDWRLEMWKEILPTVPKYLINGKGFAMDVDDSALIDQARIGGYIKSYEGAMLAGDYHSGPLSLIIPFGLFGVGAFAWFLIASVKALRQNYEYGDSSLKNVNGFLLAYFIAHIFVYLFVFGSFYSDLPFFTSLIGLGVSLNSDVWFAHQSDYLPQVPLKRRLRQLAAEDNPGENQPAVQVS